jgi:tetratricopeptide (TPR) repeat protein
MLNNTKKEELWFAYIEQGKRLYAQGSPAKAAMIFHRAEELASDLSAHHVRRGVSQSWLALCYFQCKNISIAEHWFQMAEHILGCSTPSALAYEIEVNLAALGELGKRWNVLPAAQKYHTYQSREAQLMAAELQRKNRARSSYEDARRAVVRASAAKKTVDMRRLRGLDTNTNESANRPSQPTESAFGLQPIRRLNPANGVV